MKETFRPYLHQLIPVFGEREAASVLRILLEDAIPIAITADHLSPEICTRLDSYISRLLQGEPVQYITGKTKFFGNWLKVNPAVLIPRQETEELVDLVLQHYPPATTLSLLDIGTGSGCIPIAIKKKRPIWQVFACDISEDALDLAAENATSNQVDINFFEQDILQENALESVPMFDIIVSNPPYIPENERKLMPVQVLEHEPAMALFVSNEDPLVFYRQISRVAIQKLNPGGMLFFECNEFNALQVLLEMEKAGLENVEIVQDLYKKDRITVGKKL